jgi:hypothetical protein
MNEERNQKTGLTDKEAATIKRGQNNLVKIAVWVALIGGAAASLWYHSPAQFLTGLFFAFLFSGEAIKEKD